MSCTVRYFASQELQKAIKENIMLNFCSMYSIIDNCGQKTIHTCNILAKLSLILGTETLETYQCSSVSSQTKAKELHQKLVVVWHQDAPNHAVLPIYSFLEQICLKWDVVDQMRPFQRVVRYRLNNIL